MNPVLSICIPTYNRARLLENLLVLLESDIKQHADKIELVVSDNGSADNTAEIVHLAQKRYPINFRRLKKNQGGLYNIVTIVSDVAKGKFCWILGDDDLLRAGAVAKVIDVIDRNPEVSYIFVNHSYEPIEERDKYNLLKIAPDNFVKDRLLCWDLSEKVMNRGEDVVLLGEVPAVFTSLVSHVFHRDVWCRAAKRLGSLEVDLNDVCLTYKMIFPHIEILLPEIVSKRIYYVGFPCVMFFVGAQDWLGIWKKFLFTFVLDIAYNMNALGASSEVVEKYRNLIFKNGANDFRELAFHHDRYIRQGGDWTKWKFSQEDDFSMFRLLCRYWKNREFRAMFLKSLVVHIKESTKKYCEEKNTRTISLLISTKRFLARVFHG